LQGLGLLQRCLAGHRGGRGRHGLGHGQIGVW
jgi:hypothetical protein